MLILLFFGIFDFGRLICAQLINASVPLINANIDYQKFNWSVATQIGDFRESYYYPAYYVDFSPCSCDLTPRKCDLSCCCDKDCSNFLKSIWNCTPGLWTIPKNCQGGVLSQFREYLQIFLQLQYSTTPYLGHFFNGPGVIRTASAYTDFVPGSSPTEPNFGSDEYPNWESLIQAYPNNKIGSVIRTQEGIFDSLPSPSLQDDCTWRSPITFLKDSNVSCSKMVTSQTCSSDPRLNPLSYMHTNDSLSVIASTQFPFDNSTIESLVEGMPPNIGTRLYFCSTASKPLDPTSNCQLINSQTLVRAPAFQNDTNTCRGVVAAVWYRFYWSGSQIMNYSEIFLIDALADQQINQYFSIMWTHKLSANLSALSTTRLWPGYVWNDVVYGTAFPNDTDSSTVTQAATVTQIPILKSIDQNSCPQFDRSNFEPLRFGPNIDAGCFINVNKTQFRDCNGLRNEITQNWTALFGDIDFLLKHVYESTPQSQNKNTKFTVNDIIEILRPNTKMSSSQSIFSATPPNQENFDINENLTAQFLDEYRKFMDSKNPNLVEGVAGTQLLPFSCDKIPVNAFLEIMYAASALINGSYLNAIVGARLSFRYATWRFSSRLNSTQKFFLGQSIRFIKVPPNEPAPIKKYYLTERRDHCPSAVTCWDELFYPFLDWFPVEAYRYTQAVGLSTILGVGSLYLISRPWW